ncbi:MAG: CvpA family protein [Pseudomonadota bacterium]
MALTPNSVDSAIILILFVFAILAFLKGFIKDFFSTVNLILATIASYFIAPMISKFFIHSDSPQMVLDLGIRFAVFVAVLIICSIISSKISTPLSEKIPGAINQSLGFGFGFAKGYFILAFIFAVVLSMYSGSAIKKEKKVAEKFGPSWFKESKSYGALAVGANWVKPFIDNMMQQVRNGSANKDGDEEMESLDKIIETKKIYDQLLEDQDKKVSPAIKVEKNKDNTEIKTEPKEESGYTKQELEKMKRLIEIMSN